MKKPVWLRTTLPSGDAFAEVAQRVRSYGLHTVCTAARCPNLADCWNRRTATFLILGNTCTRHCQFCSVPTGNPQGKVEDDEPARVAAAARQLNLRYIVITSVTRDDLPDLGAGLFARTVTACRAISAGQKHPVRVEVLVPDFAAKPELIRRVVDAEPDVFGHNLETVRRLAPVVRDRRASYEKSIAVLQEAKRSRPNLITKSGLMVGLGETDKEVLDTLSDLRSVDCDIVTIGQYLQPTRTSWPVARYVPPEKFEEWEQAARKLGFQQALCGPLVRSSFHAAEMFL